MGFTADAQPLGGDSSGASVAGDAVAEAMAQPRMAAADGVSITTHGLADLIAAEKYLAAKAAAKKSHRGLRFSKLVPPGTIGGS